MEYVIQTIVNVQPDAIQLTVGQAKILQSLGKNKPSLALRTGVANIYGTGLPKFYLVL